MLNNHHRDPNKGNTDSILSVVPTGHTLTGLLIIYQVLDNITWHDITPVTITQTTLGAPGSLSRIIVTRADTDHNDTRWWCRVNIAESILRRPWHCDTRRHETEPLHPIFGPQFNCQQHLLIFEIWFLHALRSLLPLSRSKTFIFFFMIERKLVKGSIDWQKKSWC